MNARTVLLCACFLFFGLCAISSKAQQIPGGIVYSNGKDAVFLKLDTKEKFNLTSDLSEAVIKLPKVSENGKLLVWFQNSRFHAKELPIGSARTIQAEVMGSKGNINSRKGETRTVVGKEDIVWQRAMKNFSLSPDGARFAFESPHTATGWMLLDQGNPSSVARMMAAGTYANFATSDPTKDDARFRLLPLYVKRVDSFNGIFYLSTTDNRYSPPFTSPFDPVFGNVVERVPVALFKATSQDLGMPVSPNSILRPIGHGLLGQWSTGGELSNDNRAYNSITVKKNATLLTFQKLRAWDNGNKKAAFIYQMGNQWGPIEIQTLDAKRQYENDYYSPDKKKGFAKDGIPENYQGKARELEIQAIFPSVEALAWKPDGSLSVFSQGNVFLVDYRQIQNAFDRSSMEMVQDEHDRKRVNPLSTNNVLQPKLELVAKGITGTCFNWVSDYSFIFLGTDNNVYLWNQGNVEKIADSVGEFSYCSLSPFEDIKNDGIFATGKNPVVASNAGEQPSDPVVISGTSKVSEGSRVLGNTINQPEDAKISFGPIQTLWTDRGGGKSVYIYLKIGSSPLQFALLEDDDDLGSVNDPSQYEYQSKHEQKQTVIDNSSAKNPSIREKTIASDRNVIVPLDRIIILKLGNSYAAIKPTSLKAEKGIATETKSKKKFAYDKYTQMSCEWKYWPKVIPAKGVPAQKMQKKEMWEITAIPIGKEFYIGNTKFYWKPISEKKVFPSEPKTTFMIYITLDGADQNEFMGYVTEGTYASILNPAKCDFKDLRHGDKTRQTVAFGWIGDCILVLKISDKYIAIKPVEEKKGWIQYKWKYWPEVAPVQEALAKTALR